MAFAIMICFYLFFLSPSLSSFLNPSFCNSHDFSALVQFKQSFSLNHSASELCDEFPDDRSITNPIQFKNSSYPKMTLWGNDSNCCLWDGITCDSMSGHVIGLDLSCSWLQGQLYPNNTLFQLSHLQTLNLAYNDFTGSLISSQFGDFPSLTYLNLSHSFFIGEIPPRIAQLSKLASLDLSLNEFYSFKKQSPLKLEPSTWDMLILNMTNMRELVLDHVNMSSITTSSLSLLVNLSSSLVSLRLQDTDLQGNITNNIFCSQNLQQLDLSWNRNLNGQLPKSNWSSSLRHVKLKGTNFSGGVPNSIGYLKHLNYLDLSQSQFEGLLPPGIKNLTQLNYLNLVLNKFSGEISFVSSLPLLTSLHLSHNDFSGQIPSSLSSLEHLTHLSLQANYFYGEIPDAFRNLSQLQSLMLSQNKICGKIPKWFNNLGNGSLQYLDLSHNVLSSNEIPSMRNIMIIDLSFNMLQANPPIAFSGVNYLFINNNELNGDQILSSLCNSSLLFELNLSYNNLSGHIPNCLATLPYLSSLDLQMNNLFGIIPNKFSQSSSLLSLNLNNNQLEGRLPLSLVLCNKLQVLDVRGNKIEDTFPNWLASFSELKVLILRDNKFYGAISSSNSKHPFFNLTIFDISNNRFSGPLPAAYMKEFREMKKLDNGEVGLQYMNANLSYESVVVTLKGNTEKLERILTTFTTIDLSNNKFDGEIPKVIGELCLLKGLNLSHNRLTGSIPKTMGNLISLESLDLSSNMLRGEIPLSLTNLGFLSVLNLSQNQLVGAIPIGKQFDTFQNDSYEGNLGLCGLPLSKSCNLDEGKLPQSFSSSDSEFGFGWKPVALGCGCGMVFGMLMGHIVFSTGKPQWLVKIFRGKPMKQARRTRNRIHAN